MTKRELITAIKTHFDEDKRPSGVEIGEIMNAIFEEIAGELCLNGYFNVKGFGRFSTYTRKPRSCKLPSSGELVDIPEKTSIRFKPSKLLLEALRNK